MTEGYYGGKGGMRKKNFHPRMVFEVKLICGHIIKTRTEPLTPKATFGCTLGLGCGYFLPWVRWTEISSGRVIENPKQPTEGEGDTMIPQQGEGS